MQLTSLTKGRFQAIWQQDDAWIEKTLRAQLAETLLLAEGEYLFRQGQQIKQLMLVSAGKVSLCYNAENARRFQLGPIECDEQLFGEMECFTGYPCQLDIIAQEPLTVAVCPCEKLQQALYTYPKLAIFFASAMALDYQDTLDIFLHRLLYPIAHNIAYDLYRQYQKKLPMDGFNKNYLEAERFGTTDRVYRRAVKTLIDAGLVRRGPSGLEINDLAVLEKFLGNDVFN